MDTGVPLQLLDLRLVAGRAFIGNMGRQGDFQRGMWICVAHQAVRQGEMFPVRMTPPAPGDNISLPRRVPHVAVRAGYLRPVGPAVIHVLLNDIVMALTAIPHRKLLIRHGRSRGRQQENT